MTFSAFGAHTAKRTPGTPSAVDQVRAERAPAFVERAFGVQVEVGIGDLRAEAVGVVDLDCRGRPTGCARMR